MAMGLKRFTELVAAYGGDPERWPVAERAAARAVLAASSAARAAAAEARALDRLLAPAPAPDPGRLIDAVLARVAAETPPVPAPPPPLAAGFWRRHAGTALLYGMLLIAGFICGRALPDAWLAGETRQQVSIDWLGGASSAEVYRL
jgi:hypothetical protein